MRRLVALVLSFAMLLPGVTGFAPAVAAEPTVKTLSSAEFDPQALGTLSYTDGDVSNWLEYDGGNGIMTDGTHTVYVYIIKNVCPGRTVNYVRNNRITTGHVQNIQYITCFTI